MSDGPASSSDRGAGRHVLVVSYYFPPLGGVPVRRVLRFLRHLPSLGWRCSVLTAQAPYDPFHPEDPEALRQLPPLHRLLRAPAHPLLERTLAAGHRLRHQLRRANAEASADGVAGGGLRRFLYETLAFPDPKWPWIRGAVRMGEALAREDPVDVVFATGYPWSAFVVADRLRASLGVPSVLDYRDAWTLNPRGLWVGPRNVRLETRLTGSAAAIVTATEGIRDDLQRHFPGLDSTPIVVITNGYEDAEYASPGPELREPERLVITHTGTFNDALPPSPYDRTPYYLIEAITRLKPEERELLRVRLVGPIGPDYRRYVCEREVTDVIQLVGPVSHADALRQQRAADVLLLVLYDCPGARGVLTGKLFEYAGARRPILALVPEGEARQMVLEQGLGWVEPPSDVERLVLRLRALLSEWRQSGCLPAGPGLPSHSAAARSAELAQLLDRVCTVPG